MERLYLITRRDLEPCDQAVQTCHAALEYAALHPGPSAAWRAASNTLAWLVVDDEQALLDLARQADRRGLRHALFHEPDRANELTAMALEPSARKLVRGLDLALQR